MENKEVLKIKKTFDENINSHIFLVETDDHERALADIKSIVKYALAPSDAFIANQVDNETYLELIVIRPPEREIKIDQIKELQDRIKTEPVLGSRIFYIITCAETMTEQAMNKLLKTIEEPNRNVVGFLITSNSDLLLPTIKSRCQIENFNYGCNNSNEQISDEVKNEAKDLLYAIEKKDHTQLYKIKSGDKKYKENAKIIENLIKDYYNTACRVTRRDDVDEELINFIRTNNSFDSLVRKAKYMNTVLNRLTQNMNSDLKLEKIYFDLKGVK